MPNLVSLVENWIDSRGVSPNTRRLYELELSRFNAWLSSQSRHIAGVDATDINSYLAVLEREPEDSASPFHVRRKKALGPRSREQTRRILHAFFEWAARHHHIPRSPFWDAPTLLADFRPQSPPPIIVPPLSDSIRQLLSKMPQRPYRLADLRAATIAHLAFWLGTSRSEIAALKADDFIEQKGHAVIRLPTPPQGVVEMPLPPQTTQLIRSYLDLRLRTYPNRNKPMPLVGSLRSDNSVGPSVIRQVLTTWQEKAESPNVDDVGPLNARRLRQSFETIANRLKVQERVIAKHFRTERLQSAIDEGPVLYSPKRLYADVLKEIR